MISLLDGRLHFGALIWTTRLGPPFLADITEVRIPTKESDVFPKLSFLLLRERIKY